MNKKLDTLIYILKNAGFEDEAEQVEKTKRMTMKINPLELAVSLGLINSDVLTVFEEKGHKEDMEEFKDLLEDVKMQYEDLD